MDALLCLSHPRLLRAALISFGDGSPETLKCDGDDEALASALAPLAETVYARTEDGAAGSDLSPVPPSHPLYPTGVADACRALGYEAVFFDPTRARAWFLVRTLPLEDEGFRHSLLTALPGMDEEDISFLLSELEAAAKELEKIEERRRKEMDKKLSELAGKE